MAKKLAKAQAGGAKKMGSKEFTAKLKTATNKLDSAITSDRARAAKERVADSTAKVADWKRQLGASSGKTANFKSGGQTKKKK